MINDPASPESHSSHRPAASGTSHGRVTHHSSPTPHATHAPHAARTRLLVIILGVIFAVWPMAFDQRLVAPLMNPADPKHGEGAAANLIGASFIVGAIIIAIGVTWLRFPQHPRRLWITAASAVGLSFVLFMVYIFTQLRHYGFH